MEYFWTDRVIKNKLQKLKDLYISINDEEEKKLIKMQIESVTSFFKHLNTNYVQPKMLEAYNDLKKYVNDENFSWDMIFDFIDNTTEGFSVLTPDTLKLSNDEIMTVTHDFYQTFPGIIYNMFYKNYEMRYDHVKFQACSKSYINGYSCLFPSLGENFASISKTNTIEDVFVTIHEYAHFIWSSINRKYGGRGANKYILELIPFTMELIACDYLKDMFSDNILRRKSMEHAMYCMGSNNWCKFMHLVKTEHVNYGNFKKAKDLLDASKSIGLTPNEVSSLLHLERFPEMYLMINYIYAIELYELHKRDAELACEIMIKIMKDETEQPADSLKMLERYGLIANEHSSEFHQKLVLSLKK